jgi:hypothetical protein
MIVHESSESTPTPRNHSEHAGRRLIATHCRDTDDVNIRHVTYWIFTVPGNGASETKEPVRENSASSNHPGGHIQYSARSKRSRNDATVNRVEERSKLSETEFSRSFIWNTVSKIHRYLHTGTNILKSRSEYIRWPVHAAGCAYLVNTEIPPSTFGTISRMGTGMHGHVQETTRTRVTIHTTLTFTFTLPPPTLHHPPTHPPTIDHSPP